MSRLTIALEALRANPLLVFVSAGLAIIPLAGLLGRATEHLATHVGVGSGALLNASLGNAAELIIALVALREGRHDIVRASLTGSILGNILLVLEVSMYAGGMKYECQKFNQTAAGMGASLPLLAAVGLIIPALFHRRRSRYHDRTRVESNDIIYIIRHLCRKPVVYLEDSPPSVCRRGP